MTPNPTPAYGEKQALGAPAPPGPPRPATPSNPNPVVAQTPAVPYVTPGSRVHPLAPTQAPLEPVTAGLPTGPGPGPEALSLQPTGAQAWQTGRDAIASLASSPNATPALKTLVANLGAQF